MKKILSLIGGLSFMTMTAASVVSCTERKDYTFVMKNEGGEIVDEFDKREVEDFFIGWYSNDSPRAAEIFIKFKNQQDVEEYEQLSGSILYWLKHLCSGLNKLPNQEKYKGYNKWVKEIPQWAWEWSGLWDRENNRPTLR